MKKTSFRILSFLLTVLLLAGSAPARVSAADQVEVISFSQMEYVRPDMEELQTLLDEVIATAAGEDAKAIMDSIVKFSDLSDWFGTYYVLAEIHYNADLTDDYWAQEYEYCSTIVGQLNQMFYDLYSALADSPARNELEEMYFGEGYFLYYDDQEESPYQDELMELMEQESALTSQYYTQSADSSTRKDDLAQTLVDLVKVRNKIAISMGYDGYEAYAYDYLYERDYTPEELAPFLLEIQEKLVPLYVLHWEEAYPEHGGDEEDTFAYVRSAASAMGGTIWDAFQLMEEGTLYDITPSSKKANTSFENYLTSYDEPYILVNPEGTIYDQLTFVHEFGHFCNDYSLGYSQYSIDISEVFSQAMEYLSLIYVPADETLVRVKLADSLCTYVEQSCKAEFERELYALPEEELTVSGVKALYARVCAQYGMDDLDDDDFIYTPHYYTSPMYICSYIVSNDAAMQIYQMELEESGAGLRCFEENLDSWEYYFLSFLESAGLESPFASGRVDQLLELFTQILEDTAAAA